MRVHTHPLAGLGPPPPLSWVGAAWMPAIVPRLPAHLAEQAWGRQALQRGRGRAPPWGHGGAPAGGRDRAAPSGALAPGNRRGSALPWAARAAAPGWGRTGRARRGALGRPAGARALGRGPARSHGDAARQGPRAPQSPQGRAPAPAPLGAGRRAVSRARPVARGTRRATPAPGAAPASASSYPAGPGGSDGTRPARRMGAARRHDHPAPYALPGRRPPPEAGGAPWGGERAGAGPMAAAGTGPVVSSTPPGVPAALASLVVHSPTAVGASGLHRTRGAGATSRYSP
jgi:hypothetical protein